MLVSLYHVSFDLNFLFRIRPDICFITLLNKDHVCDNHADVAAQLFELGWAALT